MWTIIEQDKPQIELPVIDEALELESSARPTRPERKLRARRILGTTLSFLAALCLLLAIPVQLLLFRPQLTATHPAFYDWLETACLDRCPFQLPTRVDPEAFEISGLDYREHPFLADTALLEFSFQNRGSYAQPMPDVVVRFSSMSGDLLVSDQLSASDYLDTDSEPAPLQPGEVASARIEFTEPGSNAVNYDIQFVKPASLPRAIQP
ncbi:DUF3426 domain-containing protein [Pseudohongiella sp. SYSU M77423]|uniref:DUF3426 domain-containing protein n=1 Tax=Pseudohongiella sp. SYSU M77423 TaxID=3042312 RepID=UPI0024807548|nr:DUF3426 domain-containing protein [Pseudohongiella sp. SYSU M77423]MDH7942658.1 DUF3426 domain-containing protein [Pseudohongiella sp. SYSU M77423]